MTIRALRVIALAGCLAGKLRAQPAVDASAQFEVASIRRSGVSVGGPAKAFTPGGGVRTANVTLKMLIQMAYDVRSEQVAGGPGWTDSELYIVVAKGPEGSSARPEPEQLAVVRRRLQALLNER
jgi:uncharacterized protein (TIGR03435 family)